SRAAEDVRGDDAALVLADVGQRPDAGHVADRPQPLAEREALVHGEAARAGLDADGLEPDALDPRPPARRDEQAIAAQLAPIGEGEHVVVALATGRARVLPEAELDAVRL